MSRIIKYIPDSYYKSILLIDFLSLKEEGIKAIFIDIDNTLVSYDDPLPTNEVKELINKLLKLEFEVVLISNNNYKRVSLFANDLNLPFVSRAIKPFKRGYKKGLKLLKNKYRNNEILVIGDQFFTDISGGNKMGFKTILVKPVKTKTDVLTTKINRYRETKLINKLKKKHANLFNEVLKGYDL